MKPLKCCQTTRDRGNVEIAGWIIPSAVLILMPKCPACIVAYVALLSGLGIRYAAASQIRIVLLVLAITALVFLAAKRVCQFFSPSQS